jgi:Na+-transporting methylmalonyl-CoA/oxaloacetate decarboxylase gamma subunit
MIQTGLILAIIGLVCCFLFLGLLVLTTHIISRYFTGEEEPGLPKDQQELEIAIAIAAAMAQQARS